MTNEYKNTSNDSFNGINKVLENKETKDFQKSNNGQEFQVMLMQTANCGIQMKSDSFVDDCLPPPRRRRRAKTSQKKCKQKLMRRWSNSEDRKRKCSPLPSPRLHIDSVGNVNNILESNHDNFLSKSDISLSDSKSKCNSVLPEIKICEDKDFINKSDYKKEPKIQDQEATNSKPEMQNKYCSNFTSSEFNNECNNLQELCKKSLSNEIKGPKLKYETKEDNIHSFVKKKHNNSLENNYVTDKLLLPQKLQDSNLMKKVFNKGNAKLNEIPMMKNSFSKDEAIPIKVPNKKNIMLLQKSNDTSIKCPTIKYGVTKPKAVKFHSQFTNEPKVRPKSAVTISNTQRKHELQDYIRPCSAEPYICKENENDNTLPFIQQDDTRTKKHTNVNCSNTSFPIPSINQENNIDFDELNEIPVTLSEGMTLIVHCVNINLIHENKEKQSPVREENVQQTDTNLDAPSYLDNNHRMEENFELRENSEVLPQVMTNVMPREVNDQSSNNMKYIKLPSVNDNEPTEGNEICIVVDPLQRSLSLPELAQIIIPEIHLQDPVSFAQSTTCIHTNDDMPVMMECCINSLLKNSHSNLDLFSLGSTWHLDESGQAVTYEEETLFSHIEVLRMELEQELGVDQFLRIYRQFQEIHETVSMADEAWQAATKILGPENTHLVGRVWQLVLADGIYNDENNF
ncbi:hypothetical protein L9F63_015490 [Diploptera punctata]|uniref:Uncharacterized protein n=1 Tax=Diploptera punctata TaxID=6984 RepID=A0AAD8A6U5_DIPPU|nr:hypothetical protein L9F63_015490 [Diploptera punctata]